MAWKLWKDPYGRTPQVEHVIAGSAIAVGELIVRAGDDGRYDPVGDNGTITSGIARTAATAAGQTVEMEPIIPGALYYAPYTGTYNVNELGSLVGINSSQVVEVDDSTHDLCQLYDTAETTDSINSLPTGYCLVRFPNTTCESWGAEV